MSRRVIFGKSSYRGVTGHIKPGTLQSWNTMTPGHIGANPLIVTSEKFLLRNSDLFPKSAISKFPTDVVYKPQYFVPLAHLLLKSTIGQLVLIVFECISVYVMYVSALAYAFSRVCIP